MLKIDSAGAIRFNNYSGTNKTGTPTFLLGTDASGNIVKTNTVPGSAAGPYLPLAGGTMTGSGSIHMPDNFSLKIGSASNGDAQLYHNGIRTELINFTGDLRIVNGQDDGDIIFRCDNGSGGTTEYFRVDGGVARTIFTRNTAHVDNAKAIFGNGDDLQIYHDGTNNYIHGVTGDMYIQNGANDRDIYFQSDNGSGGVATYFFLDGSATQTTFQLDTKHNDNIKAKFGDSVDLEIYHDGTHSYIDDSGTGKLILRGNSAIELHKYTGEYMITAVADGAVSLYYDDSKKLETTNTGVTVTGSVTATTFLGDLNGTINTATTAVTQVNAVDNETVATTAYVNNKIALIPAGLVFQGTWNAASNSPTLTSGSGTTGNFYIVSTPGNTNLDGITDWKVGDWAVFIEQGASDQWEKIDNSSVLDGIGTGQTLPLWSGSGTSNTLTNSRFSQSATANIITGPGNAATDKSLVVGSAGNTEQFYIQGTGEVVVTQNYLYVSSSQGAYINGILRARSGVTDDSSTLGLGGAGEVDNLVLTSNTSAAFAGNVGIGVTSPTDKLAVNGNLSIFGNKIYNGSASNSAGVSFPSSTTRIDGYNGITFHSSTTTVGSQGERMRITNAGNVGIGTTTPAKRLHISASDQSLSRIRISNTNTGSGGDNIDLIAGINNVAQDGFSIFNATSNQTQLVIRGSGNVGIGTTSPNTKLQVGGDLHVYDEEGNTDARVMLSTGTSNVTTVKIASNGSSFFNAGDIGIGTTSPSYKLTVSGGGIQAGGKVTYTKSAGSLNTTGYAVAGITADANGNGSSCGFTFTCFGHTGGYQKIVYSCYNGAGTWYAKKVINEGTNQLDVVASANGSTITFTFKAISSTMHYTPRVTVEATGNNINSTYA